MNYGSTPRQVGSGWPPTYYGNQRNLKLFKCITYVLPSLTGRPVTHINAKQNRPMEIFNTIDSVTKKQKSDEYFLKECLIVLTITSPVLLIVIRRWNFRCPHFRSFQVAIKLFPFKHIFFFGFSFLFIRWFKKKGDNRKPVMGTIIVFFR